MIKIVSRREPVATGPNDPWVEGAADWPLSTVFCPENSVFYTKVSQPWHYWRFVPDNPLLYREGGDCPLHCWIFNSIPGLCPLGATSTFLTTWNPSFDNQKCLWTFPSVLLEGRSPLVENHGFIPDGRKPCPGWLLGNSAVEKKKQSQNIAYFNDLTSAPMPKWTQLLLFFTFPQHHFHWSPLPPVIFWLIHHLWAFLHLDIHQPATCLHLMCLAGSSPSVLFLKASVLSSRFVFYCIPVCPALLCDVTCMLRVPGEQRSNHRCPMCSLHAQHTAR